MQRIHKIALIAIIPAIALGGFFMADMFTQSESTIPSVDATMEEQTINEYSIDIIDSIELKDSVDITKLTGAVSATAP